MVFPQGFSAVTRVVGVSQRERGLTQRDRLSAPWGVGANASVRLAGGRRPQDRGRVHRGGTAVHPAPRSRWLGARPPAPRRAAADTPSVPGPASGGSVACPLHDGVVLRLASRPPLPVTWGLSASAAPRGAARRGWRTRPGRSAPRSRRPCHAGRRRVRPHRRCSTACRPVPRDVLDRRRLRGARRQAGRRHRQGDDSTDRQQHHQDHQAATAGDPQLARVRAGAARRRCTLGTRAAGPRHGSGRRTERVVTVVRKRARRGAAIGALMVSVLIGASCGDVRSNVCSIERVYEF